MWALSRRAKLRIATAAGGGALALQNLIKYLHGCSRYLMGKRLHVGGPTLDSPVACAFLKH
jgi:hypothetical protein